MNIEEQRAQLQAQLDKITDAVKASADAADKELKRFGDLTSETKAETDKALAAQSELRNRLNVIEQALAKGDTNPVEKTFRTAGEKVADSAELEAFNGGRGNSKQFTVSLKGGMDVFNVIDSNAITSTITSGTLYAPERQGIHSKGQCRLSVRDLLSNGRTNSGAIEFVQETTFDNQAAGVRENPTSDKPQSKSTFKLVNEPTATIAHWMRASKQILSDAAQLASFIDGKLRYGLAFEEESQLLKGGGSTQQELHGIYTQATAYATPTGASVTGQQIVDTLRLAILQAERACYYADGIVMSIIDWANLELLKDTQNRYLFGNPFGQTVPTLWGRSVVSSKALDGGEWLVGAFGEQAQLFDREDATVTVSLDDRDNFVRNMVTILAEQREVLAVYQPGAFIKNAY